MTVRGPGGRAAAGSPREPGADPGLPPVAGGPPVAGDPSGSQPSGSQPSGSRGAGVLRAGGFFRGSGAGERRREETGPGPVPVRVFGGVLVALAGIALAVVESFLVPLRIGGVPIPVAVLLAAAGNVALPRLAGRWTGSVPAAAVPAVLWLVVVIVLSLPRAEGDLIVPGTVTGLVFLFVGSIAGAFGVATTITRVVRPRPPARG